LDSFLSIELEVLKLSSNVLFGFHDEFIECIVFQIEVHSFAPSQNHAVPL
jgi:hypothetical protein